MSLAKLKQMKKSIVVIVFSIFFLNQMQSQETAKSILDKAYNKAKIENKNVFVLFKASWCGWCKKMEANMNQPATKKLFTDNFVVVHLDVQEREDKKQLENPGATELLATYKGDKSGIPFFLIFDAYGKLLADSFDDKGQNLGCPASVEEVAVLKKILKDTSTLSDEELEIIAAVFQKK